MKLIPTCFLFLLLSLTVHAQKWDWARVISSTGKENINQTCSDNFGNTFLLGSTKEEGLFDSIKVESGTFLAKYDIKGKLVYVEHLTYSPYGMKVDFSGNLFLYGNYTSSLQTSSSTFNTNGAQDFYLIKISPKGKEIWARSYGSISTDWCRGMAVDKNGNCFIAGSFSSDTLIIGDKSIISKFSKSNFFTASINSEGATNWVSKGLQQDTVFYGGANSIGIDINSNVYVLVEGQSCKYCHTYFIVKYSSDGKSISNKIIKNYISPQYWTANYSNLLVDDSANLYFDVEGYRYLRGSISKMDTLLKVKGGCDLGASWSCFYYNNIVLDSIGNMYLCGATTPFGGYCSQPNTSFDLFVKKLDATGNLVWDKTVKGNGNECPNNMSVDRSGNCYITGSFNYKGYGTDSLLHYNVPFDSINLQSSKKHTALFIAKLGTNEVMKMPDIKLTPNPKLDFSIYPNPASDQITIQGAPENSSIRIFNAYGQTMLYRELSNSINEFDVASLPKGIYIIEVNMNNELLKKKFVLR